MVFDGENRPILCSKCNGACSFDWIQEICLQGFVLNQISNILLQPYFFKTRIWPCPIAFFVFEAISLPKYHVMLTRTYEVYLTQIVKVGRISPLTWNSASFLSLDTSPHTPTFNQVFRARVCCAQHLSSNLDQ